MSLRSRLADAIGGRARKVAVQEQSNRLHISALCSAYENLFAQVRPVVNGLKSVIPYAITESGRPLGANRADAIAALMSPNEEMGFLDFMDIVFVQWLTLSEVNIHVHRDARGKIYGYSILPASCRVPASVWGGETDKFAYVNSHNMVETLYPDEVMTLRFSRSPLDIDKGVSPADAVFVWSQIDDLMAQYQKAFLENGAVPAHITIIRASSREKFEKKKADLERGLGGARNKNKTVFIYRQQLDDGQERDEMEIKTIQGSNASLAIKELVSVVDDRLNKAYGVSNFILGNDSSAKYDNAELSELRFTTKVVYPMLTDFWNKFQHELDRITGGLGYAITFDMTIPELTDRAKVKAETKKVQVDSLTQLISNGATAMGAISALELGTDWLPVANALVSAAEESRAAANAAQLYDPFYFDSHKHGRHHTHDALKITDANYTPTFNANEQLEKKIYDALMELAEEIASNNDIDVDIAKTQILEALTAEGNRGAKAGARRIAALLAGGAVEKKEILQTLKDNGFQVSAGFTNRLTKRVDRLVESFETHTKAIVAKTLTQFEGEGKSASEISRELRAVLPKYRAETIARNETRHAFQNARLETDEAIANKYGFRVKLIWNAEIDDRTCEVCEAMNGQETYLGTAFTDSATTKDGTTVGWEQTSWNDYGREPNAHVNCRCTFDEVFE